VAGLSLLLGSIQLLGLGAFKGLSSSLGGELTAPAST
jgi:hypothetical protein